MASIQNDLHCNFCQYKCNINQPDGTRGLHARNARTSESERESVCASLRHTASPQVSRGGPRGTEASVLQPHRMDVFCCLFASVLCTVSNIRMACLCSTYAHRVYVLVFTRFMCIACTDVVERCNLLESTHAFFAPFTSSLSLSFALILGLRNYRVIEINIIPQA